MKNLTLILFSALFLVAFAGFANHHNKQLDSLELKLKEASSEEDKINLLNSISFLYSSALPKKAIEYGTQALERSKKISYKSGEARALSCIGTAYFYSADYDKSLFYSLSSLRMLEEMNNKVEAAKVLGNLGLLYSKIHQNDKALDCMIRSLKLIEETGNKKDIAKAYRNLAGRYRDIHNNKVSLEYYDKALKMGEEINDKELISSTLQSIGTIYYRFKDFKKSIEYNKKALAIYEEMGQQEGLMAMATNNIGMAYRRMGDYKNAHFYMNRGMQHAKKVQSKELLKNSYESFARLYAAEGNYEKAYEYKDLYATIKDSIYNEESQKLITEMQTKYETEKKEQEINLLTKENQLKESQMKNVRMINYGLGALMLLFVLIGYMFVRQNRLRTQQRTIELEQKLLRSQMNPHFIFNTLGNIQAFIYDNKTAEADEYLSKFAQLIRLILENSREEYVPLEKEIITIENYIKLQALHHQNKFDYTITVDPAIDEEIVAVPPMLAQPFIENAIQHGIQHKETKGQIDVRFKLDKDMILFEVEDNGIGRAEAEKTKDQKQGKHHSLATTITRERLALLNKKYKTKIKLNIIDKKGIDADDTGTKVVFDIPYRKV